MKLIKVRVADDAKQNFENFKKELNQSVHWSFIQRNGNKLKGYIASEKPFKENDFKKISDRYFKDYVLKYQEDVEREKREKEVGSKVQGFYYNFSLLLKSEEDIPAKVPAKRYEKSGIDREKVRQMVQEINKKFPLDFGGLPIKRARWAEKKGQVYIDCEVPEGQLKDFKKETFIPIIKKYFPQSKIKFYDTVHMERGLTWIIFRYYILEQ